MLLLCRISHLYVQQKSLPSVKGQSSLSSSTASSLQLRVTLKRPTWRGSKRHARKVVLASCKSPSWLTPQRYLYMSPPVLFVDVYFSGANALHSLDMLFMAGMPSTLHRPATYSVLAAYQKSVPTHSAGMQQAIVKLLQADCCHCTITCVKQYSS